MMKQKAKHHFENVGNKHREPKSIREKEGKKKEKFFFVDHEEIEKEIYLKICEDEEGEREMGKKSR
jgi:hypothetical protein